MLTLFHLMLLQIPQRYRFSSKSQQGTAKGKEGTGCYRYHKGTDFQANHNGSGYSDDSFNVVIDTTKVQIFKQITTVLLSFILTQMLLQIPQRYRFSSKSQQGVSSPADLSGCYRYHKGTDFQANHNVNKNSIIGGRVVIDTTKVQIFKQITTWS